MSESTRYLVFVRYTPKGRWHFRSIASEMVDAICDAASQSLLMHYAAHPQVEVRIWGAPYPGPFVWSFTAPPPQWRAMIITELPHTGS